MPSLPKNEFLSLLKSLLDKIKENSTDNLKAGFRKTGIWPVNKAEVMSHLSGNINNESTSELVCQSFIEHLTNAAKCCVLQEKAFRQMTYRHLFLHLPRRPGRPQRSLGLPLVYQQSRRQTRRPEAVPPVQPVAADRMTQMLNQTLTNSGQLKLSYCTIT